MKIIYLNIEHGESENKVLEFLTANAQTTDIFCLEEIDRPIFDRFRQVLKDFEAVRSTKDVPGVVTYYLGAFVSKKYSIGTPVTLMEDDPETGFAMTFNVAGDAGKFQTAVVHGISQPADKLDNEGRQKQSATLIKFMSGINLPKIIGGDFNLMPETESVKMFKDAGYKNLVKDFNIKTTRSKDAWDKAKERHHKFGLPLAGRQLFADYLFVSDDITVNGFDVPGVEVSDHLPLILDFDLKK